MGKKLPGITLAFENPKGGVGKSTLTALFAGYTQWARMALILGL